jgi:hypothetical protein
MHCSVSVMGSVGRLPADCNKLREKCCPRDKNSALRAGNRADEWRVFGPLNIRLTNLEAI